MLMARRLAVGWALVAALGCGFAHGQEPEKVVWPGLTRAGSVLLPNGWSLKPAGKQSTLGDFPVQLAEHPTLPILAALHAGYGTHEVVTIDARTGKIIARVAIKETYTGLAWSPDGAALYASGGTEGVVHRFEHADGLLSKHRTLDAPKGRPRACLAGLAVSADGLTLWAADVFGHAIVRFGTEVGAGDRSAEVKLGDESYPYGLAWDESRGKLYASLWGKAQVAVVNVGQGEPAVVATWEAQEHPNEMILARGGKVLYVANANRNTVSVFDAEAGKATQVINTAIAPDAPPGSTPNSLALSADEKVLFVANANTNDVAAINVESPTAATPLGFIPVGWYPTSVRVARDGKTLHVANGKGGTSKPNREGPMPGIPGAGNIREYIGGLFQGTLSMIPMPDPKQMAALTRTVYECSPLRANRPADPGNPIPSKVGDPSPITHCVYIIKENRTYDQVFGDIPEGNGEPALCLFPEKVTPNHHALAREFVLLDNFYVEAEVSADGHEWSMGAYATDFVERTWPLGYRGNRKVPYPAEGAVKIAEPSGGYLWDKAAAKGVTYRSYGEFVENPDRPGGLATTKIPALQGHFDPKFIGYDLTTPDQKRADRFLEELAGFEQAGEMPRLIVLRLPNDHTAGTVPGRPTVSAYVADNDLALGRVVEGLSKSRFWKGLAIFVVEDDAQNGSDHVDAHRTVALAISPYSKRKSVDSTMYSTSSMLRTMELCLGLDPMSQFDAAARPMANAFGSRADLAPYASRPANIDLNEKNPANAPGAEASLKLDLDGGEDRADDLVFNEIIWKAVRGANSPMPPPVRAAFIFPRD